MRTLPTGAADIQEFYRDHWNGDFVRLVRAKIPESELREYALKVGAKKVVTEDHPAEIISWSHGPSWWSPEGLPRYCSSGPDQRVLVGWQDGYVYFDAAAW
ncbi:hypothetical protein [Haloferula sp. A504]|uniref:hypothetical protein n=1 Tax=Haloferula sp. A504 TaxID=3373601 RepID=UPI0031BC9D6E|nr:hypothetical protein [Verrucomicrobiaceae bacterium E54]